MSTEKEKIWIANLPPKVTEYAILKIVKPFGKIVDFFFHYQKDESEIKSLSYCFITFGNPESADKAQKSLNKSVFNGKRIVVQFAKPKVLDNGDIDTKQLEILIKEASKTLDTSKSKSDIPRLELSETELIEYLAMKNKIDRHRGYLQNFSQPDFYDKLSTTQSSQESSVKTHYSLSSKNEKKTQDAIKEIEMALKNISKNPLPTFTQSSTETANSCVNYLTKINQEAQKRKTKSYPTYQNKRKKW